MYSLDEYEVKKFNDLINCKCDFCQKDFKRAKRQLSISLKRNQIDHFCSKDCSRNFFNKKRKINCSNCNSSFLRTISLIKDKNFCSRSCAGTFNNKKRFILNKDKIGNCSFCNSSYNLYFSKRFNQKRYCSIKCKKEDNKDYFLNKQKEYKKQRIDNGNDSIVNCSVCNNLFEFNKIKPKKICSLECRKINYSQNGRKSVSIQSSTRRSKNENYFSELCSKKFNNIELNKGIFNGWDADIILHDIKIAVLWNGKWHYEKITKNHSLKQVQNRDLIKIKEIIEFGYTPYIIKDMGKFNKTFVENEFNKLLVYIESFNSI